MFPNPFRTITPAEMLARQLADAERHLVVYTASMEEVEHHVSMLHARVARIRQELQAMNNKDTNQ